MNRLVVTPDAEQDICEASDWLERKAVGLGVKFEEAIFVTIESHRVVSRIMPSCCWKH